MAGPAVIIMGAGGLPVTNGTNGTPFTVSDNEIGFGVTLVDAGGLPVTLLNADGSLWTDDEGTRGMQFDDASNSQFLAVLDDF